MFCRNCGQPVRDGASFCGSCGEPVVKKPEGISGRAAPNVPQQPKPPVPPQQNQPPYTARPNQQPQYPQQPYPNQQFRQGAAPVFAAPPQAKTGNALLIAVIVLLSMLLLIAGVLLFIKPGYLLHREEGNGGVLTLSGTQIPVQTESPAESVISSMQTTAAAADTVQTPEPAEEAAVITDVPQDLIGGSQTWMYSTSERPVMQEFEWCVGQFGFIREAPEGADYIRDVQGYSGGWKALIIYNPDDPDGCFTRELDNIYISVDESNQVELVIDWYLLLPDYSEITNLEDTEDSVFSGGITNTGLSARGPALISIDNFWNGDGKQYALGSVTTQDGTNAYLAMVRP